MKKNLIIGIDENSDIDAFLSDGIRQFYFGYILDEYLQKYSTQTSLNRRYRISEQFCDEQKLFKIIEKISSYKGTVYLALNSFTSNKIMLEYSKKVYELFQEKVDGIIVANISIATMLKQKGYDKIILSNLFGSYSTPAVEFFIREFNSIKIILPRDMTLKNIETIVTSYPNMKFECFLYGDNCRYSEGFCFSEHGYDSVGFGSLCSYAMEEKRVVKSAKPNFKQIIKNSSLSDEEKREILKKKGYFY